jgi:hypothetical protein
MLAKEVMKSWADGGVLYTLFRMREKDFLFS